MGSFKVYIKRGTQLAEVPITRIVTFLTVNGMLLNMPSEDNNNTALDAFLDFKDDNDRNLFLLSWSEYFATLPPFEMEEPFHNPYIITNVTMWDDMDDETYEADDYL